MKIFTDAEKQRIDNRIDSLNLKCPVCGGNSFFLSETPYQVVSLEHGEDGKLKKYHYTNAFYAHCLNCGYIMQFHLETFLK